jgi:arsenite-transporting ATPase
MTKIIIFTGKGGVGKSSISTAHALEFANENRKTLLISTDMAHNLGDIFKISIGHKIVNVKENLDVIELNPNFLRNEMFPKIKESAVELSHGYNIEFTNLNENFVLPGFGNLFCLLKIKEFYDSNEYDYIVVDCAPTGETLALLKIPELLAWRNFFQLEKL